MDKGQVSPFLKWVGGKRQLLKKFKGFYPRELLKGEIKCYAEPFVGGGAVFFDLINNVDFKNIYLSDVNSDLINIYIQIKERPEELIKLLEKLEKEYLKKTEEERKLWYYKMRSKFNLNTEKNNLVRAAQFIFLNRTCYNGLYRINLKGEFNVPAGRYKSPRILDSENLRNVSVVLQNVNLNTGSFLDLLETKFSEKTFFYFDPPYRPISKTANFTSYHKDSFNDELQVKLFELFSTLNEKGHYCMLSNSDPKNANPNDNFFDELYKKFHINRIPARRMVNSDPKKRGAINEIIVTNYSVNHE